MIDQFQLPEVDDDDDMDVYAALGLNTPVGDDAVVETSVAPQQIHDPLAAFMDDDDEEEGLTFGQMETTSVPVEELLATLARDLFDDEMLQKVLPNITADMNSMRVHRDRDAYHLSLIIDMGGEHIKPFATVIAVEDEWKPLNPPKGLHARWKPIYESLMQSIDRCAVSARSAFKHLTSSIQHASRTRWRNPSNVKHYSTFHDSLIRFAPTVSAAHHPRHGRPW